MRVAMMQPSFLPWQGFFELIYQSERFIFLDDFQFSVQSYHQRNRLFSNPGQVDWFTVPIRKSNCFKLTLNNVEIMDKIPWRSKMLKRIRQNYSKASFYEEIAPVIEASLTSSERSLGENNLKLIMTLCGILNLDREFRLSSELPSESRRSKRVMELLRWCEADEYYCARGSFEYMREDGLFPVDNINILFQDFKPRVYPQVGNQGTFQPYLSIIDALMNIGPDQTMNLIVNGTEVWRNWDEMVMESLKSAVLEENSNTDGYIHEE